MRKRSSVVSTFVSRLISSCAGVDEQTFILSADGWSRDSSAVTSGSSQVYPALPLTSRSTFLLPQHLDLRRRARGRVRSVGAHPGGSLGCTETGDGGGSSISGSERRFWGSLEAGSPLAWAHAALLLFSGGASPLTAARIFFATYLQAGPTAQGRFRATAEAEVLPEADEPHSSRVHRPWNSRDRAVMTI